MSESAVTVPTLNDLLARSAATDAFRAEALELEASKKLGGRIRANGGAPPVKVLRTVMQLLDAHSDLAVDAVEVDGRSGCSDFRGTLRVTLADGTVREGRFVWDCAWRAAEQGWKTFWGDADQQRAAREFGYRCFEVFEL